MRRASAAKMELLRDRLTGEYFPRKQDEDLSKLIDNMLKTEAKRLDPGYRPNGLHECSGLAVIGETGAGKTTALNQAFRSHRLLENKYGVPGELCPLISVNAPAPCNMLQLGRTILQALGYPILGTPKKDTIWQLVRGQLAETKTLILHIDEVHNITRVANVTVQNDLMITIKGLLNDRVWPVAVVLSGLPEIVPLLNRDREVTRRIKAFYFTPLDATHDKTLIVDVIADFAKFAGVSVEIDLPQAVAERLAHAAGYAFGAVIETVVSALCIAAERGGPLTSKDFSDAYVDQTGCLDHMNPFITDDWAGLKTMQLLAGVALPVKKDEEDPTSGRGSRSTRSKARTF